MNKLLIIIFSCLCVVLMFATGMEADVVSTRVFCSSIIIQIISIYHIFSKGNIPYSLNKIFYLFSLFFYGISPLLQFHNGSSFFGARRLAESEYFFMNIFLIFILFIYQFFYSFFFKKVRSEKEYSLRKLQINRMNFSQSILLIVLAFFSFYMIYKANNSSILSMFVRGGEFKEYVDSSTQSSRLIIFRVFQPMSMMCLLYYISSKSNNTLMYLVLGILALVTCFPTGMARFSAAAIYIPLLLMVIPWMRRKNVFSIIFVLGLLTVFPFLNGFRNFGTSESKLSFDFNMFTEGHFDSYQNFTLIVTENIITWGRQLVGTFLFWIPRSIWLNKPIGSGAYLANQESFYFDNVSCNFFAEGYINFGFLGVFIFLVILSYITAKLDKLYWTFTVFDKNSYFNVIYFVLLGMLFFILRGDLMSSFAYTIGFLISIWFVYKIMRITA